MTVSVITYINISNLVLLACSYLNLSKNSSLNAFVLKADAKVRSFFELPKLFRSFFKKFFLKRKFISQTLFQNFNLYRISLDCGCKGRAFIITHQMHETLFCNLSATFYVSRWFTKDAIEHNFIALVLPNKTPYIIMYTRAWGTKKLDKLASKIWFII